MKKVLFSLAAIVLLSTVFITGCKKGEDDPGISFRSRDARVTGSWTLSSSEVVRTDNETITTTNDVNTNKSTRVNNNTTATSITGSSKTVTLKTVNNENSTQTNYNYGSSSFTTTTTDSKISNTTVDKYTYVVDLDINKDMTYTVTYHESKISTTHNNTTVSGGITITDKSDTTYSPVSTKSWTETGKWAWLDSKKDKVVIMAGPMSGYVKRLSNKEIIIEDLRDANKSNTDYSYSFLQTYNDVNDIYKGKNGNIKSVSVRTTIDNDYQVWEAK